MLLFKYKKFASVLGLIGLGLFAVNVTAEPLAFSAPEMLSENSLANKTKLVRMGNGWLVSVYGDAAGPEVYDTKADATRLARDIFVRVCHPAHNSSQCSLSADWSAPLNISNTAHLTSIATGWNETIGVEFPTPFYGDSEKPNIFVAGNFAVVTWVGKYCPGDKQRLISYTAREGLSVPFSCLYMSYTNNVAGIGDAPAVWNTQQLTDGSRDAKSDFNKGLSIDGIGKWVFSWQEDPHGLQLGGASGPGEGASGATVTHGTDIWYTYTEDLMGEPLETPVRISDNYTIDGSGGNTSPVYHPDDYENEIEVLERGNAGASRPNLMLVGGSPIPTAVIAYEESKGADRLDSGKFVRYHEFAFNSPPVSTGQYENGEPGCIISDPLENSRRVRFVAQSFPSGNGLRMGVFWRQGLPTEGGPGDIMVRVGKTSTDTLSTGLRPEDMLPVVDFENCSTSDYLLARELANVPASNISSNTVPWSPVSCEVPLPTVPDNDLADTTSENPYEDAKAHRAAIVGDDFYIGYSYAKDWAVATVIDMDNYNFWLRRYNAQGLTDLIYDQGWTLAKNISKIADVKIHVKEPRLVKTPGSGMGCGTSYDENCQDKDTLILGWGTETNVYAHIESSEEGDIYYTRTKDKGLTFEDPVVVEGIGDNNRFESQLRPSPAGNIVWTVWNEADNSVEDGGTHAMLSVSDESVGTAPLPPTPTPPAEYDLALDSFDAPANITEDKTKRLTSYISNAGPDDIAEGIITVVGVRSDGGDDYTFSASFGPIAAGAEPLKQWFEFTPTDFDSRFVVEWTATVTGDGDTTPDNNTGTGSTNVNPVN